VAVIGTGASAIQFVPAIAPTVGHLTVLQRTPAWIVPRPARPIAGWAQWLYRYVPLARRANRAFIYWTREATGIGFLHPRVNRFAQRVALAHLRRQVPDPALREKLTPSYIMGCKRVLVSNDYFPALAQPHVDLVTDKVTEVSPEGVRTADGMLHPADTIILGTGFRVTDVPMAPHIVGRDGRTLAQVWSPSMTAHRGTMVAGFPNLFVLLGPNTGLGHNSVVVMLESQISLVLQLLDRERRNGIDALEPTEAAQRRWTARVDARMRDTVWVSGGCASWYLDSTGRNSTLWPGFASGFRVRLWRLHPDEYVVPARQREAVAA
jgi:cation diffusion facilitator CzcD-associated flavoprotein CzcO